jgi:hypothetical protein
MNTLLQNDSVSVVYPLLIVLGDKNCVCVHVLDNDAMSQKYKFPAEVIANLENSELRAHFCSVPLE